MKPDEPQDRSDLVPGLPRGVIPAAIVVALIAIAAIITEIADRAHYARMRASRPTPVPCLSIGPTMADSYAAYYANRTRYCRDAVIISLTFTHSALQIDYHVAPWNQQLASRWLHHLNGLPQWWPPEDPLSYQSLNFHTAAAITYASITEDEDLVALLLLECELYPSACGLNPPWAD